MRPAERGGGGLRRFRRRPSRRGAARAGEPLHELRRAVLPERARLQRLAPGDGLPAAQPHPRDERPLLPWPVGRGGLAARVDQPVSRVHGPRVPGALRDGVQPGAERRGRDHPRQRARYLGLPVGARHRAAARAARRRAPRERGGVWPRRPRGRVGARAARHARARVRARRAARRPADVRHPQHEAAEMGGRAPREAHGGKRHRVYLRRRCGDVGRDDRGGVRCGRARMRCADAAARGRARRRPWRRAFRRRTT